MANRLHLFIALMLSSVLVMGCRLPGREGPVSASLARCREYSDQGALALYHGQLETAEDLLSKAVKSCPEDPEARTHWAEALWRLNRREEAVTQLEKVVELQPSVIEPRVRLARMRIELGQTDQARSEIETVIDIEPDTAPAWALRARILESAGDLEGALADYDRALGLAPDDAGLLIETAELHRRLNQPEKALSLLHTLMDTYGPGEEPQRVDYLEGLAYAALDRFEQAAESYAAALARGPATPELYYQLAVVQSRAGRSREAVASAEAALQLAPNHEPSRRLLNEFGVALRPRDDAARR